MTSERVIKEAPVPVRRWHDEGKGRGALLEEVAECGWSTDYQGALREVEWARKYGVAGLVAFVMSDGSKVVVNARFGRK